MIRPDVPIMNLSVNENTRDEYLKQIKQANAGRVWIAFERYTLFCDRKKELEQLYENLRFFENPYPAIYGFADLYSVCAERDGGHVGIFQNHSIDPVFDFDIVLNRSCTLFKLHGATGVACGNKIHITSDFLPQSTILLEVEYKSSKA